MACLLTHFIDPFAHVTWREKELFGSSGNRFDYIAVKGTTAVDFRADNVTNFDSLEKIQLIYTHLLKACICKIEKTKSKILEKLKVNGEI